MKAHDDICAVATGMIQSAIAIIRISGQDILCKISPFIAFYSPSVTIQSVRPRYLYRARWIMNNELIDDLLFACFKSPQSYTGEDMVELYCHGSLYIQSKILKSLQEAGIRIAEPGEFTLRAYLNGKMDLTQAEAVHDIITARDQWSHKLAIQQMKGGVKEEIADIRRNLLELLTYVELELDFAEEDVEFANREKLQSLLETLIEKIERLSKSYEYGQVIKNGVSVAIVGETNVGKSTLMNTLLNEDKSIVSSIPGTTRDIIEDSFVYEGVTFRFADTAGIRHSDNEIEKIGIERAIQKALQAKIVLLIVNYESDIESIRQTIEEWNNRLNHETQKIFVLVNKIDKADNEEVDKKMSLLENIHSDVICISAKFKKNIHDLLEKMVSYVHSLNITGNEHVISSARQWNSVEKALAAARNAMNSLEQNIATDLLAEDLKQVNYYLAEIAGEVLSNEVLSEIFSRFCIGK